MTTNKLPKSEWTDYQAAGSQSQQYNQDYGQLSTDYVSYNNVQQSDCASNDASYANELSQAIAKILDNKLTYESSVSDAPYIEKAINIDGSYKRAKHNDKSVIDGSINQSKTSTNDNSKNHVQTQVVPNSYVSIDLQDTATSQSHVNPSMKVLERVFMNGLIKHTGIALAIIIPLAAFSAYAAPQNIPMTTASANTISSTETLNINPDTIIYKSVNTPTTVDSVDLAQYAGTWYEIGRLPMYFQRNCASNVTANYASKADGSGIVVTNKCSGSDGKEIVAEGLAKPADETGSKLKVTFLPSWIRWLPVGRADYWVLARDAEYKTALVGTPDKKYLWLLARSPNITQQTYAKYRQIAQQQGYDLREFALTSHTGQTVNLVP